MVKKTFIPDRRDIVLINLNPARGHEQADVRPALVLSPKSYNQKTGLMVICPITSQVKLYPFEVALVGKKITGVVLSDQIRTVDWTQRQVKFIEKTTFQILQEVNEKQKVLIF
jgi:mRNA interferase MazF